MSVDEKTIKQITVEKLFRQLERELPNMDQAILSRVLNLFIQEAMRRAEQNED